MTAIAQPPSSPPPGPPTVRPVGSPAAQVATADVYLKNMAALWRADSRLAHAIDQLPAAALLPIEPTRTALPTAAMDIAPGRRIYLHSRYDPAAEAEQLCRGLDADDPPTWTVVLCGLGLGHVVAPLRDRLGPDGLIVAVEPDLLTLKTALSVTDLSEAIAEDRLIFVTSDDPSDLHARLDRHTSLLMLGTRFLVPSSYVSLHAEFFQRVRKQITDYAGFARMSLVTLVANARITCKNIALNLAAYLSTPPIDELAGRFRGLPAVVVAAGPSLGRNVDQLLAARDRVVIIAVQTTLKPLLARGIQPDFVTTLDFSDLSKRFFEGVDPGDTELIAEPKASWEVIDTYRNFPSCTQGGLEEVGAAAFSPSPLKAEGDQGGSLKGSGEGAPRRLRFLGNDFAVKCLGPVLGRRSGLRAGSTVAHLSFYLGEYLGCDPIIMIGQDLGFSGGVYYTPGVAMHDMWRPELGRFCSLEMKEWERIARARPILHRAIDIHDRPIYTDEQMFTYRQQFERDFAASAARVIDATEGGVRKRGAEPMPLAEALERFATRPIDDDARLAGRDNLVGRVSRPDPMASRDSSGQPPRPAGSFDPAPLLAAGREQLDRRLTELAEFRTVCEETRGVLCELTSLLDRPAEFDRRIARVDELRAAVDRNPLIFSMVCDVSQQAELQKFSADRRLGYDRAKGDQAGGMKPEDRARRQLARDSRFVEDLLDGCEYLHGILTAARDRMNPSTH